MKKFLALLASLTAVATLGLATACGDKGDSSTPVDSTPPASTPGDSTPDDSTPVEKQYTVTVKKPDGTPAAGYWLQACAGTNCQPIQTDANGVCTFKYDEDATVYHVQTLNGGGDDYANYEAVEFNTVPGTLTYDVDLVEKAPVEDEITISEPLSGTGTSSMDENFNSVYDYFVIESGKYYASTADNQKNWADGFTIVSDKDGTYTLNLLEDMNEAPVIVSIEGVEIPRNEADEQLADGFSFPVKANVPVRINVCSYISDETTGWETVYYNAYFGLTFDDSKYEANGTQVAPFALESGSTYTVGETNVYYYFTAPSAGQYKLTVNADWADVNVEYAGFRFLDANYDALLRGVAVDIAEAETIAFFATNSIGGWDITATTWTFSFDETLENDENCDTVIDESIPGYTEDNPLVIEAAGDYEITVLAGANFYAQFVGAGFQFVVPEGMSVQTLGMPSAYYEAGETVIYVGSPMNMFYQNLIISANAETTATLSVSAYVAPVVLDLVVGSNTIVLTEENYEAGVEYTFVAPVSGTYNFSNTGVFYQVTNATTSMPVGSQMSGPLPLEANETYTFLIGSMGAGEYTLTIIAPEDGEEGGDEVGGSATDGVLEVGVAEKLQITAENIDEEHGVSLTFTPDTYGKYQFKGDLKTVVYDNDTLDLITATSGQYTLQAGKEYWIIAYNFMPNVFQPGEYTITAELKEVLSEGGNEEVEADGSEEAPFVIEDLFAAPIVTKTGINDPDMVWYTFTLTEGKTLVFTFDNTDSWFRVKSESGEVVVSGYSQAVFEGTLSAGKYTMGIASWDVPNDALSLTVTEKVAEGGDDVGGDTAGVAIRITFPGKEKYAGEWSSASKCATVADAASATTYYMEDAGDGNYYIYFLADGVAQYLYLSSATSSASIATATDKASAQTWTFDESTQCIVNTTHTNRALYYHNSDGCMRAADTGLTTFATQYAWYEVI
ncbi:MAG: hypothetical protein IJY34_02685 [Clostridia bacterium]|nr:hypothetical protein [Clostridia bacterium]